MSASWGGVCSTLTIVNPLLLLHAGNLSGEYVISVVTTQNMGIWRWWMCWFVDYDKYFTV